jgi:hypothetical protein
MTIRLPLLLAGAALMFGAAAPAADDARDARAQAKLDKALAGRVAAAPVDCVEAGRVGGPEIIDGRTILYRDMGRVWRNDLPDQCGALRPGRILVVRLWGSRLCRGDFVEIADGGSSIPMGSCRLGGFTPYQKAK